MADIKWVKLDPDAALVGSGCLSLEQCGAYWRIIFLAYSIGGDLPDDEHLICRHLHCRPQTWRRLRADLIRLRKLHQTAGKLRANRVETELKAARKRIFNATLAAEKRWENNDHNHAGAFKDASPTTTTTTSTEVISKEITSHSRASKKANGHSEPDGFSMFWTVYPRHNGKGQARKALAAALRKTTLAIILAAVEKQKTQWRDPQFIPYPATWLNGERWLDEPQQQRGSIL